MIVDSDVWNIKKAILNNTAQEVLMTPTDHYTHHGVIKAPFSVEVAVIRNTFQYNDWHYDSLHWN